MTEILVSRVIPASPGAVWRWLRDFDALPRWHPAIAQSEIEGGGPGDRVGCVRAFSRRSDGGKLRERLLALDDPGRTLTYNILSSPMPVADYVACLRVVPVTMGGGAFVQWTAQFQVTSGREADVAQDIAQNVFAAGLASLERCLLAEGGAAK